jgi:hypothetical protein
VAEFNPRQTTVPAVHDVIVQHAADLANRKLRSLDSPPYPLVPGSDPFRPVTAMEGHGKLSLMVDADTQRLTPEQRERFDKVTNVIAVEAIQQALLDKQDLFVGLIVGSARAGRNYFDYFDDNDQQRLF